MDNKYAYETFDDWFHELEKFSYRSERFHETINMYRNKDVAEHMLPWLKAAFECGREIVDNK